MLINILSKYKHKFFFIFLLLGFFAPLKSQNKLFFNTSFYTNPFPLFLSSVKEKSNIQMVISPIRHEAFFCKMEDKIYGKLNIWITIRAGNDDIYRKLITTP
jgi:hypothetical protein